MIFTQGQQEAIDKFSEFIGSSDKVFILKGYAGTGKTTIVKEFLKILSDRDEVATLMAPTGRASLILQNKTGCVSSTIHRGIYSRRGVTYDAGSEESSSKVTIWYPDFKELDSRIPACVIVDEASMISHRVNKEELYRFGSGNLLEDLLEYVLNMLGTKIVFVGDPAQLPPVGDNVSMALCEKYFEEKGLSVVTTELTEVVRQGGQSAILKNATSVRNLLSQTKRNRLQYCFNETEFVRINRDNIVPEFLSLSIAPSFDSPVIIAWTNKSVAYYNSCVREFYYPDSQSCPCPGDKLVVVSNNYYNETEIYNGEFAILIDVSPEIITLSAPVYDYHKKREIVSVTYRRVQLKLSDGVITDTLIIDSLLNNDKRDLSYEEMCSVYINAKMRYDESGRNISWGEFQKYDPYINALRVKYGYSITGHKSQGGEWQTVYVDFSGRNKLDNDSLRWTYTALTRASKKLYAANTLNYTLLSGTEVLPTGTLSKYSVNPVAYGDVPITPYHGQETNPALRAQFFGIESVLSKNGYKIKSVRSFPYKERYIIENKDGTEFVCDGSYTKSYVLHFNSTVKEVAEILNNPDLLYVDLKYEPTLPFLRELYEYIGTVCSDEDIVITNVIENVKSYNVVYYLKTSGRVSMLKVFFNGDNIITNIIPSSNIAVDEKLDLLLNKLNNNEAVERVGEGQ